jgi:hypothetical protein
VRQSDAGRGQMSEEDVHVARDGLPILMSLLDRPFKSIGHGDASTSFDATNGGGTAVDQEASMRYARVTEVVEMRGVLGCVVGNEIHGPGVVEGGGAFGWIEVRVVIASYKDDFFVLWQCHSFEPFQKRLELIHQRNVVAFVNVVSGNISSVYQYITAGQIDVFVQVVSVGDVYDSNCRLVLRMRFMLRHHHRHQRRVLVLKPMNLRHVLIHSLGQYIGPNKAR